jgi:hypothetical protein
VTRLPRRPSAASTPAATWTPVRNRRRQRARAVAMGGTPSPGRGRGRRRTS